MKRTSNPTVIASLFRSGKDTMQIATLLGLPEHLIANKLPYGLAQWRNPMTNTRIIRNAEKKAFLCQQSR